MILASRPAPTPWATGALQLMQISSSALFLYASKDIYFKEKKLASSVDATAMSEICDYQSLTASLTGFHCWENAIASENINHCTLWANFIPIAIYSDFSPKLLKMLGKSN